MDHTDYVIVTRHSGLAAVLADYGFSGRVIAHATPEDVEGRHVIGVLPMRLAALAASVTELDLDIPQHLRGQDLDYETCKGLALGKQLQRYVVRRQTFAAPAESA